MNDDKEVKLILTVEQQKQLLELLEEGNNLDFKIEIPLEENRLFKITTRINEKVWKEFNSYCKNKKYYTQKDHLSRALLLYMKNNE